MEVGREGLLLLPFFVPVSLQPTETGVLFVQDYPGELVPKRSYVFDHHDQLVTHDQIAENVSVMLLSMSSIATSSSLIRISENRKPQSGVNV